MPIPVLFKHTVLGILEDPKIQGNNRERFERAMRIAKAQLTKYGFLVAGSEDKQPDQLVLTSKGVSRERKHQREGKARSNKFDVLYKRVLKEQAQQGGVLDPTTGAKKED